MKKLLMTIAMTLAVSSAFADEAVEYNEPYVPMLEIPNLISMSIDSDPSHSGNSLLNPNKILYMTGYSDSTTLYFMSALNKPNSLTIKGSIEQVLYEFSKNKCSERKPECTIKDSNRINLYKTPIFISIEGAGDYSKVSININNIEYIATNSISGLVEIILSPYTAIPTKLSMDELSAVIYGATH